MGTQQIEIEQLPDVMKVDEVAKFLRINRGLVYEMVRQKKIPAIRLGRAIRIPKLAVVKLVNGGGSADGQNR